MPSSEIMVEEALCGLLNPQKHRGPTSLRLMTYASINPEAGNELVILFLQGDSFGFAGCHGIRIPHVDSHVFGGKQE